MLRLGFTGLLHKQFKLGHMHSYEWNLLTDCGVKTGKTAPGGPSLDGLQVGKRYRFQCAEVTEPGPLWLNRKTLYLQGIEAA